MVLRSFVYIDDTQSLFLTFDLYIIISLRQYQKIFHVISIMQ